MSCAGLDVEGTAAEYVFKANNPFMDDLHSFAKAKSLFRHGILSEAVYALEAEVSPANDTSCHRHLFLILKRPYTGNVNREMSGDRKNAFLHCGDVLVLHDTCLSLASGLSPGLCWYFSSLIV